jgi:hypothetical protein
MLDQGSQFTSKVWEEPHESMDTKLNFSSAYHPQIGGQTERTNRILEDMLRAYALKYEKVGTRVCITQRSCTTTATKSVSRWHHTKLYMDYSVELHCSGVRPEKFRYLDLKY